MFVRYLRLRFVMNVKGLLTSLNAPQKGLLQYQNNKSEHKENE